MNGRKCIFIWVHRQDSGLLYILQNYVVWIFMSYFSAIIMSCGATLHKFIYALLYELVYLQSTDSQHSIVLHIKHCVCIYFATLRHYRYIISSFIRWHLNCATHYYFPKWFNSLKFLIYLSWSLSIHTCGCTHYIQEWSSRLLLFITLGVLN